MDGKRNMAGGEKKRVSEIERERAGHAVGEMMKAEPIEFAAKPASGECQYKELSEQENPIVGEEVAAEYVGEMSGGNRFEAFQRFDTVREVVEAFAITYNDDSIRNNREYGATIYKDRDGKYYYSTPNEGTEANIWMYTLPENKEDDVVALVHSHGSTTSHDNENLSKDDISTADDHQMPVYVVTPGGKIQKYDPKGQRTRINAPTVNPAIPSDPKAGNDRLTEVDPSTEVANPSIPKYQQVEPPPSNKK